MQVTRTPADVLATLSHRYREHYEDRLVGIYAVPEFPFSDEEPEETDPVVDIAMEVTEKYDWWMGVFVRHVERDSDLAGEVVCKGIVV